jgi:hypothetical protein
MRIVTSYWYLIIISATNLLGATCRVEVPPGRFHFIAYQSQVSASPAFWGLVKSIRKQEVSRLSPLPFHLPQICIVPATLIDTMLAMPYLMRYIRMFQYRFPSKDYRPEES